ncbi:MAG: NAD(P)/FAD-dependent oxidoreductase, partial [Gammaproteobacteria bacterium]|nr:NAD(P)/FAD-dependent oxidoreductase [Gammaproteobacteria bacterium]
MKTTIPDSLPGGDEALREAIAGGNLPTLMMVAMQLSGELDLLERDGRPSRMALPFDEGTDEMSPETQSRLRERVFQLLRAWRDSGAGLPPVPPPATLMRMMGFCVGEQIPAEYVPMMLSDMGFNSDVNSNVNRDLQHIRPDAPEKPRTDTQRHDARPSAIVIGAGASGLLAGIKLREAGLAFTIIEKNATLGGTWFENTYPDCRVDTPNHFYSYSFEPNHDWSCFYSPQPELLRYLQHCAHKYGINPHIRFKTEVTQARFDEHGRCWRVTVKNRDGEQEQLSADVLICAVGQLNRPKLPRIEGLDRFQGPAFHSAHWDHDCDLRDRRVSVIGTGASAMQFVPRIAEQVGRLSIFQRSPQWALHNPFYHQRVSAPKRWLLQHLPYYASWYRFRLFWGFADALLPSLRRDPDWAHPERSMNARNDQHRRMFLRYIEEQVGDDPALLAKVRPDYPPFGKRMLIDNHWYRTLKRDNVDLLTDPILRIEPDAIVTEHDRVPTDVIIYATGFHANRLTWPIEFIGRGGRRLSERWGEDDPRAFLGICVPEFPNLFLMYGPNTNLAHGGSIIFHAECQMHFIMACLHKLLRA